MNVNFAMLTFAYLLLAQQKTSGNTILSITKL